MYGIFLVGELRKAWLSVENPLIMVSIDTYGPPTLCVSLCTNIQLCVVWCCYSRRSKPKPSVRIMVMFKPHSWTSTCQRRDDGLNEWIQFICKTAFTYYRLCTFSPFFVLSVLDSSIKMVLKLKSVLITDEVDPKCVSILESNGVNVTVNTKLAKDKPALLAEIPVSAFSQAFYIILSRFLFYLLACKTWSSITVLHYLCINHVSFTCKWRGV